METEPMHVDSSTGIEQMIQTELLAQSILTEDERKAMIKAKRAEAASHARQVKKEKKEIDAQAIREGRDPPSLIEKMKKKSSYGAVIGWKINQKIHYGTLRS